MDPRPWMTSMHLETNDIDNTEDINGRNHARVAMPEGSVNLCKDNTR